MGPDYLGRGHFFSLTLAHPIRASKEGMLRVLLASDLCLVGPSKYAFFAVVPSLWNILIYFILAVLLLYGARSLIWEKLAAILIRLTNKQIISPVVQSSGVGGHNKLLLLIIIIIYLDIFGVI